MTSPTIAVEAGREPPAGEGDARAAATGSWLAHLEGRSHGVLLDPALILAVALAVRIAFVSSAPPFLNMDSEGYYLPARDLVAGLPFDLGLRRTPAYPLFIAATISLVGEDLQRLVTVQHFAFGVPTAMLTYVLGRLVTGRLVALAAGILVAVSGPLLLYEHYVMTEAMFAPLLLGLLICAILAARRTSLALAACAGLLLGVCILCRPAAQAVAPFLVVLFVLGGGTRTRRATMSGVMLGVAALVVVPWMLYNLGLHGAFTVAGNGRFLLSRTIKQDPGGFSFASPAGVAEDETRAAARRIAQQESARRPPGSSAQRLRDELGLSEAEANRVMFDLAIEAIGSQPTYYLLGSARFIMEILVGRPVVVRREGLEWKEVDWERRARPVLQMPVYPLDGERAQTMVSLYDPARYGPLVPMLFVAGLAAAVIGLAPRGLLVPGLVALVLLAAPAFMTGPELRYRYPQDPLITIVALQAVAAAIAGIAHVEWRLQRLRAGRGRVRTS